MPAPRIPHLLARSKLKPSLRRRVQHLAFVRQLPCVTCGKAAPSEAAHVRTGTDGAYDRLKLGIPTSSHFHKIVTPQGKPSRQWREYACVLIAERILQRKIEFYNSPAMERGLIVEADAADWYEFDQDVTAQKIGFITDDNHTVGCSPDWLVGDDGLLEIKAPLPHTQVAYWIFGEINERFWPQLQGQLYVSQRSWVDIVS